MSSAQDLANALHRFNAKERNYLMRYALLGETSPKDCSHTEGWVSPAFFEAVSKELSLTPESGLNDTQAKCVYAAMDYHLDWLHAALWEMSPKRRTVDAYLRERSSASISRKGKIVQQYDVMGNGEDVDLLMVVDAGSRAHIVLVEAKCTSSFKPSQLSSKLRRLELILNPSRLDSDLLLFDLVLLAPTGRGRLSRNAVSALVNLPPLLRDRVFPMVMPNVPGPKFIDKVTRCKTRSITDKSVPITTPEGEKYPYWRVVKR